jgi:fermentation-respiration switch protein FrsA (DUF1100 family)
MLPRCFDPIKNSPQGIAPKYSYDAVFTGFNDSFARGAALNAVSAQIFPMLAVSDGNAAIEIYKAAFGATVLWHLGDDHLVAGLEINGQSFFWLTSRLLMARAVLWKSTRTPQSAQRRFTECCKAPWSTRPATCGSSESFFRNLFEEG